MRKAIILDKNDVKKLIAEKFGVEEKDVIQSAYSYTVAIDQTKEEPEGSE